jgi:predicted XRE-type DNA-binding protein
MTAELAEEIRDYAAANPGMSHQAIAEVFNVNHGRVSEAIKGKRA